jgi:hypothetical protein
MTNASAKNPLPPGEGLGEGGATSGPSGLAPTTLTPALSRQRERETGAGVE